MSLILKKGDSNKVQNANDNNGLIYMLDTTENG